MRVRVEKFASPSDEAVGAPANEAAPAELPRFWRGILASEDELTGDDRLIKGNALTWTEGLVLPLRWIRESTGEGHSGAVSVGTIERVWRSGSEVWGEGRFDLESEEGREAARRVLDKQAIAPSVDLDRMTVEFQVLSTLLDEAEGLLADEVIVEEEGEVEEPEDETVTDSDGEERIVIGRYEAGEEIAVVLDATIRGATLVDIPAFVSTTIEPAESIEGGEPVRSVQASLLASSVTKLATPRSTFDASDLPGPTPLTVKGRRIYGHIALWGTCHTGFQNECLEPPSSASKYLYFHTGEYETTEGPIPVGRITLDTTHAKHTMSAAETVNHYEHTGHCVAYVRAGEDAYGIWVSGVLKNGLSDEDIQTLRAHPPSGDWRRLGGSLELVAVLAVNSPGFPVPRALVAGGQVQSLVRPADLVNMPENPSKELADWFVQREARKAQREAVNRVNRAAADRLARRIKKGS